MSVCKVVVLLIKPIAFLPLSLPSPSYLLKLPISKFISLIPCGSICKMLETFEVWSLLIHKYIAVRKLELNSKGLLKCCLNSKGLCLKNKGLGNRCLVLESSAKLEIRQFHVVVVQRRRRDVPKKTCCTYKVVGFNLLVLGSVYVEVGDPR